MRRSGRVHARLALAGALLAAPVLSAGLSPALAQVTVNPGALDLLPSQPAPQRTSPQPSPRPAQRPAHPASRLASPPNPAAPAASSPSPSAAARPPASTAAPPSVPVVPPAIAALPPPMPVPAPRPQAPPVVSVAADAPGAATPLPGGLRITFGADRSDLNPATEAALRELARSLRASDKGINIYAYAGGSVDDPSTGRRLSLARALTARAVLITEGIPSTRIYPRALGTTADETDRDRVDVTAGSPGPATPASAAPAPTSAPASAPAAAPPK
ncbi:MAG: OmpA family protein [Janthinobacterium lividum]